MSKHTMQFSSQSVPGGWQTGITFNYRGVTFGLQNAVHLVGPVFNDTPALWAWQQDNLPDQPKEE